MIDRKKIWLPDRKKLRLEWYDYNKSWHYFVTLWIKKRKEIFWEIKNREIILNEYGKIAYKLWKGISNHIPLILINEFIIMPDHIHWILIIKNIPCPGRKSATPSKNILSKAIHWFKSSFTREIRKRNDEFNFSWQRSFFDRIIKNKKHFDETKKYIKNNPKNRKRRKLNEF